MLPNWDTSFSFTVMVKKEPTTLTHSFMILNKISPLVQFEPYVVFYFIGFVHISCTLADAFHYPSFSGEPYCPLPQLETNKYIHMYIY